MSSLKQSRVVECETEISDLLLELKRAETRQLIVNREESNPYLLKSYRGNGGKISDKWNVKVFTFSNKKGGYSVVCNDWPILDSIIANDWFLFRPPDLPVISIDDAGWGFPLCGVMVGATDGKVVVTALTDVKYFQGHKFKSKSYMWEYAQQGVDLVKKLGASPETHRVEICTGYVNVALKERLRKLGYHVRVVEIKGLLQDRLEDLFKRYVMDQLKQDIYYDPKELSNPEEISRSYYECVEIGKKHFPHLLKTGWKSIKEAIG